MWSSASNRSASSSISISGSSIARPNSYEYEQGGTSTVAGASATQPLVLYSASTSTVVRVLVPNQPPRGLPLGPCVARRASSGCSSAALRVRVSSPSFGFRQYCCSYQTYHHGGADGGSLLARAWRTGLLPVVRLLLCAFGFRVSCPSSSFLTFSPFSRILVPVLAHAKTWLGVPFGNQDECAYTRASTIQANKAANPVVC